MACSNNGPRRGNQIIFKKIKESNDEYFSIIRYLFLFFLMYFTVLTELHNLEHKSGDPSKKNYSKIGFSSFQNFKFPLHFNPTSFSSFKYDLKQECSSGRSIHSKDKRPNWISTVNCEALTIYRSSDHSNPCVFCDVFRIFHYVACHSCIRSNRSSCCSCILFHSSWCSCCFCILFRSSWTSCCFCFYILFLFHRNYRVA